MDALALLQETEILALIGSWEWDVVSGSGTCSPGFFRVYGLDSTTTVTLCDWMALGFPDDRPAIQKVFDDAIAGVAPFAGEHRISRHNDGAVRYVRVWGRVVRGADGSAVSLIGATQDVTESIQSEWRHAQLAAIVANADVSIIGTDLDTRVTSWNHGAEQLYGYTPAEAIGQSLAALIAPTEAAQLAHNTELIRQDTVVANFRGKRRTKDGRLIEVVATISPVRDVLGNIVGASAIAHNITPFSELERALEVNLTKYATLFELAPFGISVIDDQGNIVEANREAERLLGIPKTEIEQRTLGSSEWRFVHPDGSPILPAEFASRRALIEQRRVHGFEAGMVTASGKVTWISIDSAPLPLPGYGVISAYTDITDRKRAEEVLLRFNNELEQQVAERTVQLEGALAQLRHADAAKDAFLAAVSHELRTPLAGVLGMADALEMQFSGPLNERQLYYVQQVRASGNRLLALVDAVLGYTALIAGRVLTHTLPCRLLDLAIKSLHTIRPFADAKHQALRFSVDPDDLEIASDPSNIIQVLDNLLDNAVKFTPEGGKVALEITYDAVNEVVQLTVWDTGIGIAPEQQEAIFKPFAQVDSGLNRMYTGVGLGLPSAFQIVRILGGTITVESQLGKGSRFIVTLPTKPLPNAG